uniref:(northern house mosquito) hypothetical protein n=1 Tax=Culex pipiens TaxID=7175 RepID=A0A8D8AJS9_CULPI
MGSNGGPERSTDRPLRRAFPLFSGSSWMPLGGERAPIAAGSPRRGAHRHPQPAPNSSDRYPPPLVTRRNGTVHPRAGTVRKGLLPDNQRAASRQNDQRLRPAVLLLEKALRRLQDHPSAAARQQLDEVHQPERQPGRPAAGSHRIHRHATPRSGQDG